MALYWQEILPLHRHWKFDSQYREHSTMCLSMRHFLEVDVEVLMQVSPGIYN
jgi:hypothetical protein